MKILWYISFCLVLIGCEKDNVQSQLEKAVILKGIVVAGENRATIELGTLESINGVIKEGPIQDASAYISGGGQESILGEVADSPGTYSSPLNEITILPGNEYQIDVVADSRELSAIAMVPMPLIFTSISDQTVIVDETEPGELVFECAWVEEVGFEYVFVLVEPSDEPVSIEFGVPSGNFNSIYQLPTDKTFLRIYDTDFRYYGNHTLKIYKIDREYSELFRYTPGLNSGALNGPDNVQGGSGYFTGVSQVTLELFVQEP